MMIVISTQDHENYAAHQGFTGDFYWKAKGGSDFKIIGVPKDVDIDEVVEMVREDIERDDEYFRTTIIGYDPKPDNYLSWFEQSQLDYEGTITFKEPVIEYSDLVARYSDPMQYANVAADNDAIYYGA